MNMLGRQIPLKTARKGGYFFVMRQDGTINASLDLSAYSAAAAPVLPSQTDWLTKAKKSIAEMYLNATYGDCVIASLFHLVGVWTGNETGTPVIGTDQEVLATYRIWNPRGDNGCDISTVNNYWRDHGVVINGQVHKIDAYVSVDNTNWDIVKAAVAAGFMLKLGIDLPGAWEQTNDGDVWDVTNSRVVGGHDVPCIDFKDSLGGEIATWAGTRRITKAAFTSTKYITEAYAILSPDWYSVGQRRMHGINAPLSVATLGVIAYRLPFSQSPTMICP